MVGKPVLVILCGLFCVFLGMAMFVDIVLYQQHYTRKEVVYRAINGTALLCIAAICLISIVTEFGIV